MVYRVNILFEDRVWEQLKNVPSGERSKAVNEALSDWLLRRQRLMASSEMDKLRKLASPVSTKDIVETLKQDRQRQS
jgi:hypothetical protein